MSDELENAMADEAASAVETAKMSEGIHPLSAKLLWLADPKVKDRFIWVSVIGLIITVLLSFVFPNKHPGPWEPGLLSVISYGVIGFGAYTIVVLSAAPLFKLLSRDEDYYGEGEDHDLPKDQWYENTKGGHH